MVESSGPRPIAWGAWLLRFELQAFNRLNRDWLGAEADRAEALRRFLGEGIGRLAPIAFDARFDPNYYREVHPEYGGWSDEAAYRQWLFVDLEKRWPGSPEEHAARLGLALSAYPESFDWRAYLAAAGMDGNRWFALERLAEEGAPPSGLPINGPGGARFAAGLGLIYRGRDDRSAVAAFETAQALGDRSFETAHQLADAVYRRGDWAAALALFQRAADHAHADEVWTYVNGARAALRLGSYRAAAALLSKGAGWASDNPEWRRAVHEIVEARFAARTRRARRLYASPRGRARADRAVTAAAEAAAALWDELDPTGGPLPGAPGGKRVLIFANFDIPACVHYRVEQKAELLRSSGYAPETFRLEEWAELIAALADASALIVFRLPAWPTVLRVMRAARRMGIPVHYDVDDLIFDPAEYPDTLESYGGLLDPADYQAILFGTPLFRTALSEADFGLAPTTTLARAMAPLVRSGRAFVTPNALDSRNEAFLALPRRPAGDGVGVIYASGTKAHNADWDQLAAPAVLAVLEEQPSVRLTVVGHLALSEAFDRFGERVRRIPHVDDRNRFWSLLAEADVNLAVLKPAPATDAKSEIKWLEAAMLSVPSVVSATATYREVLEDGRNVLMAETEADWREALRRICADPELRRSIGDAARRTALERYAPEAVAPRLAAALSLAVGPGRPTTQAAALVFGDGGFVGRSAAALAGTLEAVQVRTVTEPGAGPDLHVEETGRSVRITLAPAAAASWSGEDPATWRALTRLFGHVRPALAVLSAAEPVNAWAARICRALGVPYVVWATDNRWLADGVDAGSEPASLGMQGWAVREVLAGAAAVLTEAPALAARLRERGMDAVTATLGPRQAEAAQASAPRSPARIFRLGYAPCAAEDRSLVEAAFRLHAFPEMELTVIDDDAPERGRRNLIWGETPVRFVGRPSEAERRRLLAGTDLLLAVSVDSDGVSAPFISGSPWLGAPSVFRVRVSDAESLAAALQRLNAGEHEAFETSPVRIDTAGSRAVTLAGICQAVLREAGTSPPSDQVQALLSGERRDRRR